MFKRSLQQVGIRRLTSGPRFFSTKRRFVLSPEQQAIVDLSRKQNVVVSARPGTGKTATAEAIVAANPDARVCIITYSKRLEIETARRMKQYKNCQVFTFHGMAGQLFPQVAFNDSVLRSLRKERVIPYWKHPPYDIVVFDELQDCYPLLFWLMVVFHTAIMHGAGGQAPRIVALGDERQAIYDFRSADARYLSLSSSIMSSISPYPWTHLTLTKSFRLSRQTAAFVNEVFLDGVEYVTGTHDGPKPLYLHANLFKVNELARTLIPLIRKYGPERTVILSPSVRRNHTLALFSNLLTEKYKIPVAVSTSDDVTLDGLVIGGKVCVSTYHQFKGNERDLVIVYGVDNSYFDVLGRDLPDDVCPNTIFVALTRAVKQLVVLHDHKQAPMPFVSIPQIFKTAQYQNLATSPMEPTESPRRPTKLDLLLPRQVFASDVARHIPDEVLHAIVDKHVCIEHVSPQLPEHQHIVGPDKICTDPVKQRYEAVSDLNGMAVVAAHEYAVRGTLHTLGYRHKEPPQLPSVEKKQAEWLCREACIYEADLSGYRSRSLQIPDHMFNWLNPHLRGARERLTEQFAVTETLEFEKIFTNKFVVKPENPRTNKPQTTIIIGQADIIASKKGELSIWEVKLVTQLSLDHVVQACFYAYLWAQEHESSSLPRIVLFNVRDGEKWEITARKGAAGMKALVQDVLRAKYSVRDKITTDAFLQRCRQDIQEAESLWHDSPRPGKPAGDQAVPGSPNRLEDSQRQKRGDNMKGTLASSAAVGAA